MYVGALDGGEPTRVLPDDTSAVFAPPGSLLLVRQGVLVALRFDPTRGAVSGDSIPLAQGVGVDASLHAARLRCRRPACSRIGPAAAQRRQLVWVDRAGTVQGAVGPADEDNRGEPELAPDGRRVAMSRSFEGTFDVWLIDVGRGVASRFTFDPGIETFPLWSPDGRRVVFRSNRKGVYDLFEKPASGAGDEQPLLVTAENKAPLSWSPDGRFLLYASQNPKTGADLWALPMVGAHRPKRPEQV